MSTRSRFLFYGGYMAQVGERIVEALRASPLPRAAGSLPPFADIRVERREMTHMVFRDGEPETIESRIDQGGIVRALLPGGGWGGVTFTRLADFRRRVRQAWEAAQASAGQNVQQSPVQPVTARVVAALKRDFRMVSADEKRALVADYSAQLMNGHPFVRSAKVTYQDLFSQVHYANTEGAYIYQEKPTIDLHLTVVMRDGERVQQVDKSLALASGFEAVEHRSDLVENALTLACSLLEAEPVEGGRFPVVMDPVLAGLFVHEAFGHLSEADCIMADPAIKAKMALGRRFGPSNLNIVDDGNVQGLRGSIAYDDEGVPAQKTYLIREGELVGRLHSRETAAAFGEQPTGNARATSYRYPPLVRMTNTYIEPGDGGSLQNMIGDIALGIYACDWLGGETTLDDFSFSAKHARMIRNGELAETVRDVTFTGNVFEALARIDRIGSEFVWDESSGDCGKGEEGLPVCDGGPHIRVQDVLVGGK